MNIEDKMLRIPDFMGDMEGVCRAIGVLQRLAGDGAMLLKELEILLGVVKCCADKSLLDFADRYNRQCDRIVNGAEARE